MHCNFEIKDGIYLVQAPHTLDLHNDFDFQSFRYSVEDRILQLFWRRLQHEGIPPNLPASLVIEFREVSEFRFQPRDADLPFTEDHCLSSFGYWTDEDWVDGVMIVDPGQTPDPRWLWGIQFMSGALIAVQATSAHAQIQV